MANEQQLEQQNIENTPEDMDAVDIINQLKENSVSKERYDAIVAQNRKLMKSLANGEKIEGEAPKKPDIQELQNTLFADPDKNISNIKYMETMLTLRDTQLEETGADYFAGPFPTEEQLREANDFADAISSALEVADGDDNIFTADFQRYFKDTPGSVMGAKKRGR